MVRVRVRVSSWCTLYRRQPPHLGRQVREAVEVVQKAVVVGVLHASEGHDALGGTVVDVADGASPEQSAGPLDGDVLVLHLRVGDLRMRDKAISGRSGNVVGGGCSGVCFERMHKDS